MLVLLLGAFLVSIFLFISVEDLITDVFSFIKSLFKKIFKRSKKRKRFFASIKFLKFKYFFIGSVVSFLVLFIPLLVLIFVQDLPSPYELTIPPNQTTRIFDRNGTLLSEIYSNQNRTLVHLSDIPIHLQNATIAIEDKNFYKHPGFDAPSIIRAARENYLHNKKTQGGSTITQQLIKSSVLTPERSIIRKIKEIVLAFWAERIYSKKQILEMYFNQVPYGGTAWGIEAASETYFSKSVKDLTLAESAFLAGLTAAPTTYSPYGNNPTLWKSRQKEVLNKMTALKFITKNQEKKALAEELNFKRKQKSLHAPHFVAYIEDLLTKKYGIASVEKGGLQVITSLDLKTEDEAERIVKEEVEKSAYLNLSNGAALVTDPKNGDILAMVGSHDFNDPDGGNVNLATSYRQPGSSIKVVTYTAALSQGMTAATILDDSPVTYSSPGGTPYAPLNYDGRFHGKVSFRLALANSFNIPAVRILNSIGVPTMVNMGKKMGVYSWDNPDNYGLSLTLGAAEVTMLDMARVNGTLANDGTRVELNPILKITDSKGKIIEEKKNVTGEKVLNDGVSYIISDILSDNNARSMAFGPNSPLVIPNHIVSVKTGTSDNKRDNWTNGYTNNFAVVVWVGNNDNAPMSQDLASGITGAAPIWHNIMSYLLEKNPETKPTRPSIIVEKVCLGKTEYFLKGTEDSVYCGVIPTQTVKFSSDNRPAL